MDLELGLADVLVEWIDYGDGGKRERIGRKGFGDGAKRIVWCTREFPTMRLT